MARITRETFPIDASSFVPNVWRPEYRTISGDNPAFVLVVLNEV